MARGEANVGRLRVDWDKGMMNKLPCQSRKRRKRRASKLRRSALNRQWKYGSE